MAESDVDLAALTRTISGLVDTVSTRMTAMEAAMNDDRGDMRELKARFDGVKTSVARLEKIMIHGNGSDPLIQLVKSLGKDHIELKADVTSIKELVDKRNAMAEEFQRQMKLKVIDRTLAIIGAVGVALIALFK